MIMELCISYLMPKHESPETQVCECVDMPVNKFLFLTALYATGLIHAALGPLAQHVDLVGGHVSGQRVHNYCCLVGEISQHFRYYRHFPHWYKHGLSFDRKQCL